MLNFKRILIFFFLSISFNITSFAVEKVSYLNVNDIIYSSNPGKLIIASLEEMNNENLLQFKKREKELKIKEDKILKTKKSFSESEYEKKVNIFKKEVAIYKNERNKKIEKFNEIKKQKIQNFMNQIIPIIEDFMKKNNIAIIIEKKNIFIADKNYDITDLVLNLINKKF